MKKTFHYCLLTFLLLGITTGFAQKKLAQTGFQFLSVGTHARATGMAEAFNTIEGTSAALFYNPAGLAGIPDLVDVSLNQMKWIADISYISGSLALNYNQGRYGVFGISFMTVNYGEFLWTRVADNEQGFEDVQGWPEPGAYAIGLGYARQLSDRFSVGGQVKYVNQNLGKSFVPVYADAFADTVVDIEEKTHKLGTMAYDFGTLYRTGFRSLVFGMSVRNFSQEIKFEKEGFQLPLTFRIGASMNLLDFLPDQSSQHVLILSFDAVHPRSFPEYINIGSEYIFMDMLMLRAGYVSNHDDYNFSTGFGLRKLGLALDFSYTPFSIFDDISRVSVNFSF